MYARHQLSKLASQRLAHHSGPSLILAATFLLFGGSVAAGAPLAAQSSDFLFSSPKASLAFHIGYHQPRAGSGKAGGEESVWDFTRRQLTVDTRDFGSFLFTGEVGFHVSERLNITISLGHADSKTPSEFRDWEGEDDLPIEQTTEFSTTPLTIGLKAYAFERGRSVGSYVWLPRSWNAYGVVASGAVWYSFRQYGEFVDYETLDIFQDNFLAQGRVRTLSFGAGVEKSLGRRTMITWEGRYNYAKAPLGPPFVGFPALDLSGFQLTGGFAIRL